MEVKTNVNSVNMLNELSAYEKINDSAKSDLNVLFSNVDGFLSKKNELLSRVNINPPHIICLVEVISKQSTEFDFSSLEINGYYLLHSTPKLIHRGVVTFVRNDVSANPVVSLNKLPFDESYWIEIFFKNEVIVLGNVYRNWSSDYDNHKNLCQLIDEVCIYSKDKKLVIVGDFNYKDIDWSSYCCHENVQKPSHLFLQNILINNLCQHITDFTRQRGNDKPSTLDLLFTNNLTDILRIELESPLGQSDHVVINFSLQNTRLPNKCIKKTYPDYKSADFDKINLSLLSTPWETLMANKNANESWLILKDKITELYKKYIPIKENTKKFNNRPQWMSKKTEFAINKKKKAWKKYKSNPSNYSLNKFRKARNECNTIIKESKISFERKLVNEFKHSPKAFWSYVKSQKSTNQSIPDLFKPDGTLTQSEEEKADVLNKFFVSVFTTDDPSIVTPTLPLKCNAKLSNILCSEEDVNKKLNNLNTSKAPGPDKIHSIFLKSTATYISKPLCLIFNKSLDEGQLPIDWKFGLISALHKKGDRKDPNNYRPVSLTPIVCKVLESIIRDHIDGYLTAHNILSNHQYGFRAGRSCNFQLLSSLDFYTKCINEEKDLDIILLDFSKAFDSVPHSRLLSKLESVGITGKVKEWIKSFLSNRKQAVKVNDSISHEEYVRSGVPQGSVLGPTLFLLFINDLPDHVNSEIRIFADDTKLFRKIESTNDVTQLQSDLNSLKQWSDTWGLKFNAKKCAHIHVGNKFTPNYTMLDDNYPVVLKQNDSERDLGVILNKSLSPSHHIDEITKKAYRTLGVVKHFFTYLDEETFTKLYKSLIRPLLEYNSAVWSPTLKKDKDKLENVQRKATKILPSLQNLSYPERLTRLGLPTLLYRRDREDLIQVYKIIESAKNPLFHLFILDSENKLRGHSKKIKKSEHYRTSLRQNYFSQRVITNWNSLPESVVSANSLNSFKSNLNSVQWHTNKFHY